MGGATNCPETPRQKMIGMMYIVLTAMLALNVSASILEGFSMVESSLRVNTQGSEGRNENLYLQFQDLYGQNPTKVGEWLDHAKIVRAKSDSLYNQIEDLKWEMVTAADGDEADLDDIKSKGDLNVAGEIALPSGKGKGMVLKKAIEEYKEFLIPFVQADSTKVGLINKTFYTGKMKSHGEEIPWEISTFESMPLAAVTTILSKIQADIRSTEGEVVSYLKGQVDAGDYRVNKIEAKVIPVSKYVMRGSKYEAQIVLVASDSTKTPQVYIGGNDGEGGTLIPDGLLELGTSSLGEQKFAGYIKLESPTGDKTYSFESDYNVGEPSATISADMMNVFYAGIDNLVSISVPGVPVSAITASMTGGTLAKGAKGGWVARPAKVGQECIITVTAKIQDRLQNMGSKNFRVKMLPPPVGVLPYRDKNGNLMIYKGGTPFKKQELLSVTEMRAELDDADLDVPYSVLGFELNITEAMGTSVELSAGNKFTDRQIDYIKRLPRNKKFFLSGIKAKGPDGIVRTLSPMEVIVD